MGILDYTAVELGALLKAKEISCREILDEVYSKISHKDIELNAFITLSRDKAYEQAEKVQKRILSGKDLSPLAGVPIAIKDNICTAGIRTTCASEILGEFTPPYNATAVEKLYKNDLVIVGKTNMDEFAMGSTSETSHFGAVKNPCNLSCVPGGSSGGSAAAVAGGEVVCALGSDTGGSIRQPASYCGVTGFKPTYGSVSRYGLIAYASSLDQIGPIAKDVRDCAAIMDCIVGYDTHDSTSLHQKYPEFLSGLNASVKGLKIGVPHKWYEKGVDFSVKEKTLKVAREFESLGATVVDLDLDFIDYVIPTYYIIATAEASSNLSRFDGVKYGYRSTDFRTVDELISATRSEGFGKEVQKRIMLGTFVLSSGYYDAYYKKALKMKRMIVDGFDRAFKQCDIILCPVAPTTAPKIGCALKDAMKMYLSDIYTVSVNLAGLPGLSVPCGYDTDGMPVGVQFIGKKNGDLTVLNAGYAYQTAFSKGNK